MNKIPGNAVPICRTILAGAVALALCGPAFAADAELSTSQYGSTVDYATYRGAQGSYKLRASEVIGRDVRNAEDAKIGAVDDLIVSRDGDEVLAVVSLGSMFRLNSKLILIPYADLRVTKDGKHIYYNVTKAELESRTAFSYAANEHPATAAKADYKASAATAPRSHVAAQADGNVAAEAAPGVVATVSGAGGAVKAADNSANNARDRSGDTMTPLDQSNAAADVEITRNIRKVLIGDDTLGTNAQNVKVMTVDGTVTLRGAVASKSEQARIVAVAKEAAGLDRVHDELEVMTR